MPCNSCRKLIIGKSICSYFALMISILSCFSIKLQAPVEMRACLSTLRTPVFITSEYNFAKKKDSLRHLKKEKKNGQGGVVDKPNHTFSWASVDLLNG